MYRTVIITLTLLYFISLILTFKQNDYVLKHEFAKIEYYNKSTIEYMTVKNVQPNRTYRAYSIFAHTFVDWDGDTLKGNVKVFKFLNNKFRHKIFDYDVKICQALKGNFLGITNLLKTSNLTNCPIRKGYYAVTNFNIDEHQLAPFMPAGRYKLQLTALYDEYTLIRASVYVEIIYKTNKN